MKKVYGVLGTLALLLGFGFPSYALETKCKCVVAGPAASELSEISREAASAQTQADEMEAYLWGTSSPDWENVLYQMDYLKEDVQHIQKLVTRFERSEPRLTEAESQQLERLKAALATLSVFANNTYELIGSQLIIPHRSVLASNARAMSARAAIIRDAARSLRVVQSA